MKVLIQLRSSGPIHAAASSFAAAPTLTAAVEGAVSGLSLDANYPPVQVPGVKTVGGAPLHSLAQPLSFSFDVGDSTYLVRGQIPDGAAQKMTVTAALSHPDVVGVFSDPLIESSITCGTTPAVGTAANVAT